eukprot:TRINITY_DN8044_c0_g1_i1.p1 TRINITY_DN8044_c0_g1~~TRINITY_DN8044_c0_g1_i1.p1  ORF type:complete len:692 (+),score=120.98 TRINITY_DN8044_c0_g1_i1:432-2507(+)
MVDDDDIFYSAGNCHIKQSYVYISIASIVAICLIAFIPLLVIFYIIPQTTPVTPVAPVVNIPSRSDLPREDLMNISESRVTKGIIKNDVFVPVDPSLLNNQATNYIEGNITIRFDMKLTTQYRGSNIIYASTDPTDCLPQPFDTDQRKTLPDFNFQFLQDNHDVIPLEPYLHEAPDQLWEFIPLPGKIWSEPSDNGWYRVALNFAISEKGNNCVTNGLITFLLNPNNQSDTTFGWYQISSEVCAYYQLDMWGYADVDYTYVRNSDKQTLVQNFRDQLNNRIPVKSISELATDLMSLRSPGDTQPPIVYDNVQNVFNNPDDHGGVERIDAYGATLTSYGVVYNRTLYQGITRSRAGNHPYPEWFVYPMYSLGKSNYVSAAFGIVDQLYGSTLPSKPSDASGTASVIDLIISDWVSEVNQSSNNTWGDVTLGHMMNMGSSHYNSSVYGVDEGSLGQNQDFFYKFTHAEKISFSLNAYQRQSDPPGTKFGYKTIDFYIAARVLNVLISKIDPSTTSSTSPPSSPLNRFMDKNFFSKLGLSMLHKTTRGTYDSEHQPFGGYGSYAFIDDIAKLSLFWGFDDGRINGQDIISRRIFNVQMLMDENNKGILTLRKSGGVFIPNQRYHYGFWSYDELSNTTCANTKVVYQSGYGGLRVVIGRGKWVYIQLDDNYDYYHKPATNELASRIGCPVGYQPM